MVILIVLGVVMAWYLYGFMPWRRLPKQKNRLHSWGIGSKIYGYVDGDKGILPYTSLPWPFKQILFQHSWKQVLTGTVENLPKKNSVEEKIVYGDPQKVLGLIYKLIAVTDTTNKLRKNNKQVLDFEIQLPDSGLNFEVTFGAVLKVFDGMALLDLEDGILVYSQREIKDAINSWFVEQEVIWKNEWAAIPALSVATTSGELLQKESFAIYVIRKMESLRIDDLQKIIIPCTDDFYNSKGKKVPMTSAEKKAGGIPFRKYLDQRKFTAFGFKFGELSYELGYGEDVENIKKERRKQQTVIEEKNTAVENEKLQLVVRATKLNDAINKKEATEKMWEIGKTIIKETAEAQAKVNEAYKANFLVLPEQHNSMVQQMIQSMGLIQFAQTNPIPQQQTQGGS